MVKVRMNTADVAAEVKCLRKLIGMRCSNVYDLSPKTYMFKLMNSSGITESGESEKVLLLMESGVRMHTTAYVRDKSTTPSGFTLKLRKHIRTRRLEDVRQLGYDRVIVFQFGLGSNAHYVILELYAQGNILLTDSDYVVMTLLRSHRDDEKGLAIMSRHRYPVEYCRVFERTSFTKMKNALTCSNSTEKDDFQSLEGDGHKTSNIDGKAMGTHKKAGDGVKIKKATLKTVLGESLGYGPALSEHIILEAGLLPNMKVGNENGATVDENTLRTLASAIDKFEDWLEDVISGETVPEGYILMQSKTSGDRKGMSSQESSDQVYDEFTPILLNQFKSRQHMKMETFDAALDEFYSKIESQKAEQQQKTKEGSALLKLNKIRADQENRVHTLKKEVDRCVALAELIEYNLEDVDAAILAVRVALANGMDWEDLARMVKEEKKSGNPVAGLIDKLHLERNCITLLLSNNLDDMDEEEKTRPADKVEVDLALSAHANARRWYELKKRQENKQEKTITAHEKAFKAAERKTRLQLSQEKTVAAISHMRKVHWFEKFNWFVSSENYLVISGRDAQQNEMIVKRYMLKGDLYVHADLHGASSTVIKNHKPEQPIPPLTLNQAGCFTVCHSQAWESKIVTSAWWVYPHQVSKTAPTGEYLTVGSFMIRGRKNFLPPHPLIMGFGILFRLDESSLGSHLNERRVRGEDEGLQDVEENGSRVEPMDSGSDEENEVEKRSEELNTNSDISINHSKITSNGPIASAFESATSIELDNKLFSKKELSEPRMLPQLDVLIDRALELGSKQIRGNLHGLQQDTQSDDQDEIPEEGKEAQRAKPYISKAERRKLRKGPESGTGSTEEHGKKESNENHWSNPTPPKTIENPKPTGGKVSRGQRGKLKKIKEKYAEQDEEERKIRMELLASAGRAQKDVNESTEKRDGVTGNYSVSTTDHEDITKICYKCKRPGHLSRECPENIDDADNSTVTMHSGVDTEPSDRMLLEEDDIHEIGEEEKVKLNDVDYLTGNPLPNDILLYAVPVCGPYSAVQTYKYRVKITPGMAKKGKAAKTAMNLFSHMPEATGREKELMKACTDPELVAAIIGNVKITAAGLTQLKQRQKKGKKNSKQDE
ncbi:nuclear export mediator factor NEMF [Amborella trichopoda]|uniref:CCHC-type domain-containing protein n=1 Tax=Amborella trichopoda TaxID=13333 RepID=W1P0C7_AMBTC|nr:nuclear export mediator factor NEMF [Amborella trichopoda]ERN03282.1 hypothetical protein AMTR_s00003p00212560 [Amborella trichopoda]|eukprot:XP_006841607.1 nuclear export mediator factor NEMF [Amborella trichopoda]